MKNKNLKASSILLLAAAIWGFAFVAQRIGSKYLGAFSFNGIRFALGGISLLPLILLRRKSDPETTDGLPSPGASSAGNLSSKFPSSALAAGCIAGGVLFAAASLQQIGLSETSAGKAAFITGLYIVLVPIFGIPLKHKIHSNVWAGAVAAAAGLYLLSITEDFSVARGDFLEFLGAIFWAVHILLIDYFTKRVDALKLSFFQFMTCSVLSLITASAFESITLAGISQAAIPLLYGGLLSVGVAYTLQVIGQKDAKPSHAAIVLSMEAVFASLGGFMILNENLGLRGYIGCALMLLGMIISQLQLPGKRETALNG